MRGATITMRFAVLDRRSRAGSPALCGVDGGIDVRIDALGRRGVSVALAVLTLAPLGIIYRAAIAARSGRAGPVRVGLSGAELRSVVHRVFRPKLITSRMLEWAYPWLIPANRQASNPRFQLRPFDRPAVAVEGGLTIEQLNGSRVDVWIKKEGEALSFAARRGRGDRKPNRGRQRHPGGVSWSTPTNTRSWRRRKPTRGSLFSAAYTRPARFALDDSAGREQEFYDVGHAFFTLLAAWIGGMVARFAFATRESTAKRRPEPRRAEDENRDITVTNASVLKQPTLEPGHRGDTRNEVANTRAGYRAHGIDRPAGRKAQDADRAQGSLSDKPGTL